MINNNQAPDATALAIVSGLSSKEMSKLLRKVRDAMRNNSKDDEAKRSRKWTHEERKACLSLWELALSPKNVAKRRRVENKDKMVIKPIDKGDGGDEGGCSLYQIIKLITQEGFVQQKIKQFREKLPKLDQLSMTSIEVTWN